MVAATAGLNGCAVSYPAAGASAGDEDRTGSIHRPLDTISSSLNSEDWRRASAAMSVALDPQSNGAPVKWDNPETNMSGNFRPVGSPYPIDGLVCRKFSARIDGAGRPENLTGTGCKEGSNGWSLQEVAARAQPNDKRHRLAQKTK